MVYTITASVCGHAIRQSSTLPWSGSTVDFDVRYCSDLCARGLPTRAAHREAESAYHNSRSRYERGSISRADHRDTTRRYDNSRARLEEYNSAYEGREERSRVARGEPTLREHGRRHAGLDDPAWQAFSSQMNPRYGTRARIAESDGHRRESQDTSRPPLTKSSSTRVRRDTAYAPRQETSYAPSSRRRSSQRSDAYLDLLDDDELAARGSRVESMLSRHSGYS